MTSVLILAGSRGELSSLCDIGGVSSKALLRLGAVRMIDHVLRAIQDSPEIDGDIWVSGLSVREIRDGAPNDILPMLDRMKDAVAGDGPASAVLANLDQGIALPLLITTCDHPLLTPEIVAQFLRKSEAVSSDFSVGLAQRTVVESAYPQTTRTYIKLAGREYSGCNLFHVKADTARNVIALWKEIGHNRKHPFKIARRFGIGAALKILIGRLDLEGAFLHASKLVGADITPILLSIAEAAIDVDKPKDLELVKRILTQQGKIQASCDI